MIWMYAAIGAIGVTALAALAAGIACYVRRKRPVKDRPEVPEVPTVRESTASENDYLVTDYTTTLNVGEVKKDDADIYDEIITPPADAANVFAMNVKASRDVTPVEEVVDGTLAQHEIPGRRQPAFPRVYTKV